MSRHNLNEEIQKFKKLSGILNEAPVNPIGAIAELLAKIARTSLSDVAMKEFEVLEQKGLITLDKASKTVKTVNWAKMSADELKLFFRSSEMRALLEGVAKKRGVSDITDPAVGLSMKGDFGRSIRAYQESTGNVFKGGTTTTTHLPPAPTPIVPTPKPNASKQEWEKFFEHWRNTDKNFMIFEKKIDDVCLKLKIVDSEIINLVKAEYERIGNIKVSDLPNEINEMGKSLGVINTPRWKKLIQWVSNPKNASSLEGAKSNIKSGSGLVWSVAVKVIIGIVIFRAYFKGKKLISDIPLIGTWLSDMLPGGAEDTTDTNTNDTKEKIDW